MRVDSFPFNFQVPTVLITASLFFAAVTVLGLTIFAGVRLVRRRPWSQSRKKAVFAAFCAAILFPVIIPAGTIAGFPAPNILLIATALWVGEITAIFYIYAAFWKSSLIGFAITWIFFRGIAAFALFENPHKTGQERT